MKSTFRRWAVPQPNAVVVLLLIAISGSFITNGADASTRQERERSLPDLFQFPYMGHGDHILSFHQPYQPDEDGDPVNGWVQLGSSTVTSDAQGRDIVRLTTTAQANQGLLYAYTRTHSNNFNGWFDIQITTSPESHEAADGMALFFSNNRPIIGSAMGISHTLAGLGIVIDTFSNSRTRQVPYMYAYISDGRKEWNPDTDGADTQITNGCHLELNKPMRIFVQYIDEKLTVGVSLTPHTPNHWHLCFKADNVKLPFSDGGYLAFSGETGHFFAAHEVHAASFVAERPPNHFNGDLERQKKEREMMEQHQMEERRRQQDRERYERERREREEREYRERMEREHRERDTQSQGYRQDSHPNYGSSDGQRMAGEASRSLSGSLDKQVADVFNSLSDHMRGYNDHDAEDTKQRLSGVRDMTSHVLHEIGRQRDELKEAVETLNHLKSSAGDLQYTTSRFTSHVKAMQSSVRALRTRTKEIHRTHDDIQDNIDHHQESLAALAEKKGGADSSFLILFGVLQCFLVVAAFMVNKLSASSRKMGRMV